MLTPDKVTANLNFMKNKILAVIAASTLFSAAAPEAIFDGKSLDGWNVKGPSVWTADGGILIGQSNKEKQGSTIWTNKEFTDFTFECEFRYEGVIDSGVFLRHENDQIQLGVSSSLKRDMSASPYIGSLGKYPVEAEGATELLKEGEWNQLKITAKGPTYTVILNGKKVLEYISETAQEKGPIGFQVHQGFDMKIEFKDITLASL